MKFSIKGMVCNHCIDSVKEAFDAAGISETQVSLGTAESPDATLSPDILNKLDNELSMRGFERITDSESALVERAKLIIIEHVRTHNCHFNLSACLSSHLATDYSTISKLFSAHEGRTIEKYAIAQRVELVKELLSYRQLTISEIADKAGYSSVAHLSRQFKETTGLTPSAFLKNPLPRIPLNNV